MPRRFLSAAQLMSPPIEEISEEELECFCTLICNVGLLLEDEDTMVRKTAQQCTTLFFAPLHPSSFCYLDLLSLLSLCCLCAVFVLSLCDLCVVCVLSLCGLCAVFVLSLCCLYAVFLPSLLDFYSVSALLFFFSSRYLSLSLLSLSPLSHPPFFGLGSLGPVLFSAGRSGAGNDAFHADEVQSARYH